MSTDNSSTTPQSLQDADDGGASTGPRRGAFSSVEHHVQRRTLEGLVELVPLLVTIGAIAFLVGYADALIRPIIRLLGISPISISIGERTLSLTLDFFGIGAITLAIVFYLIGVITSFRPGRKLMDVFSTVFGAIPVVRVIYNMMKQAMASIGSTKTNFSRVVFVEWPREGIVALGFVTGRIYSQERRASLVSVYIPTIPNPTSGNMAFVFEDDVIETNLNPDDAMKLVFSGGIVLPETVNLARLPTDLEEHRVSDLTGQFRTMSAPEQDEDWPIPAVSKQNDPGSP